MKNMKKLCLGLLVLLISVSVMAQDVQVNVNPKVDAASIAQEAAMSVLKDFDLDIDIDFGDLDKSSNDVADYQEVTQEVEIPLSNPGQRGALDVSTRNGKIKVVAYDGPTVKVKMIKYQKKVSETSSEGGMRLVSSGGFNFEASENNNIVKVENEGWNDRIDFEIQVPRNFDVKADAYNNGYIDIEGIEGEFDMESYNGPITLNNVSGSVIASTYNGSIKVTFDSVAPDTPMAFTTYNGDVDISVPDGTKMSTKMKTNRDIFTDFSSFSIKDAKPITEKSDKGGFNIKYENWVEGNLNGGGPEVMMKTTNGNIYIRKR